MQLQFQFASFADFLAMGNYGFYVWLSYAVTLIPIFGLIWLSKREKQQVFEQVKKELARENARQK